MATNAEVLLLDTSAAIALVRPEQVGHSDVRAEVKGRTLGLSGHAAFEMYSVLTRLPPPQRLTARAAARLITTNFPHRCHLSPQHTAELVERFATVGISGGAVYDGLVGAAAAHANLTLLSLDRRAEPIYRALGVRLKLL
ncbi:MULTISPECIES: type II toxin-antitoxin system VapC family toxin [Gordonia]|uniref:Ribonuclease VapC n=1 Tax=Gordonia tangerina TaxID=2911060 RepID=A0ABS9DP32_9ACTN|nr:type II toxin-antitoxin system VapC family toxin [Gordonia tangerina]MCF3940977.1 type II toxin-antitoxin system VapC family toxin [Gordonia tangerina]